MRERSTVNFTVSLQDAQDFVSSDKTNLGNALSVTQQHTNLRGTQTLFGELANLVDNLLGRNFQPRRRRTTVWQGTARDTLSRSVHATHFDTTFLKIKKGTGKKYNFVKNTKLNP